MIEVFMAEILVKAGEPIWTEQGTHLLDENGFAVIAQEDTICYVPDEKLELISSIIESGRSKQEQEPQKEQLSPDQHEPIEPPTEEELLNMWLENAVVTMRQARLALLELNLLDSVESAIQQIDDLNLRKKAQIEWEYSSSVSRKNEVFALIVSMLGLNSKENIDNFFLLARKK